MDNLELSSILVVYMEPLGFIAPLLHVNFTEYRPQDIQQPIFIPLH